MKERIDGVLGAEYMGFWEQTYICRGAKPPSEVLRPTCPTDGVLGAVVFYLLNRWDFGNKFQNCFTCQTDGVFDATYSTDGFLGTNFKFCFTCPTDGVFDAVVVYLLTRWVFGNKIALHVKLMEFLMQPTQQMGFWEQILNFALHVQLMWVLMQL